MTFFIHDQAIKAVTFKYPHLKHGIDYLVLMGVEESRTIPSIPASDAWIEWWDASEPQPTIDELKALYADNNLDNWTPPLEQQPIPNGAKVKP